MALGGAIPLLRACTTDQPLAAPGCAPVAPPIPVDRKSVV